MPTFVGKTKGDIYKELLNHYKGFKDKSEEYPKHILKQIRKMEKQYPEWCF